MPKLVKDISEGVGYSYSSEQGQVAESQARIFRVILNSPGELFDIQQECGVKIGDELRPGAGIYCVSFDARFEGNSRLVMLCTFQFRNTADAASSSGVIQDPKGQPPDIRPPNWTTSTSLIEQPVNTWYRRRNVALWDEDESPAVNPVGDMYDGVTKLVSLVSISVTLHAVNDPTRDNEYAGAVNSRQIKLGTLTMKPHTVMFRGVQSQPVVESWGGRVFRGWTATYEFAYKKNPTKIRFPNFNADTLVDLGWDIAVPVTGFNCRAFAPNAAAQDEDVWGQPLKHKNGKIVPPLLLPDNIDPGERVRAMVKVFEYENGGTSQAPSASPIALKENGRPMKTHNENGDLINRPVVRGYQVQEEIDFAILGGGRNLFQ